MESIAITQIQPKISVITVVFNGASELEATILSVINQTYNNLEYIVVDGGSTDGTLDVISKYSSKINTVISEPDKGIYDAMNKGVKLTTGEWIIFMNCGDVFVSTEILQVFSDSDFEDADMVYGDAIIEYPSFQKKYPTHTLTSIWKEMPFCHTALFARSEILKKFLFNTSYRLCADYDFIYTVLLNGYTFRYFNNTVCRFSFKDGASKRNPVLSISERMRIALKYDFRLSRWLYYTGYLSYLRVAIIIKTILGPTISEWVTRQLRT